jgi:hypothetical protein
MWKEYFPSGHIFGMDIYDKSKLLEERITILRGSQADRAFLDAIGTKHGPFDIIVDDGSHVCEHVIAGFTGLWPYLCSGGVYAIEDLQTSYRKTMGGSRTGIGPGSTMDLLFRLANGLNYAEFDIVGYQPTQVEREVVSIAFYHNLALVQKGNNNEPGGLPPHPHNRSFFAGWGGMKVRLAERATRGDIWSKALSVGIGLTRRAKRVMSE